MKLSMNIIIAAFIALFLSGCMEDTLTAPCDQYGSFCGFKTKINQ